MGMDAMHTPTIDSDFGRRRFDRRALLRGGGLAIGLGLLTACAPGLQAPAPTAVTAAKPAPAATAGATAAARPAASTPVQMNNGQPATLRLASWQWDDPAYKPFWDQTTQAFTQKYPNITFDKYAFPIDQLFDKLNTDFAAGSPPDVVELTGFNIFDYASRDVLEPLDQYWTGTDIPTVIKDQTTYPVWNGKQYALNLSARTLQLYVNTQLFDAKQVALPTTLDEFTAAAKALTDPTKDQFGLVLVNVAHSRLYESILLFTAGNGGHFSKDKKPALNSPEVVQAVQYFKSLFDAGVMPKGVKDANGQYSYYNTGKAAMSIDGAWYIAVLKDQGPDAFKTTKILSIPTQTHASTGGVNNVVGIARASKYKDVAAEYLRFITDPKWAQLWTASSQTISARDGAVTPEFLAQNPLFDIFNKDISKATQLAPPGLETQYNAVQKTVNDNVVAVLYDNKPAQEAMDQAQKQVEAIIAKA
jgi:multiple sugar transport system substrate-binding protein